MITGSIRIKDEQMLRDLIAFLHEAPDLFQRKVPSAARRVSRFAQPLLEASAPPPPTDCYPGFPYPLRWKSRRQQRAFFATDGFGRGIPTERTGALLDSYAVQTNLTDEGGVFEVVNTAPHAPFVIGDDQQPFHEDIGWIQSDDDPVYEAITEFALDEVENLWFTLIDPYLEGRRTQGGG